MSKTPDFNEKEILFLQKAKRINERLQLTLAADKLKSKEFLEVIPEMEIANYKSPYNGEITALFFKGDIIINGDLDEKWIIEQLNKLPTNDVEAFVIEGNLTIIGDFKGDFFMEINVNKNLYCAYVFSQDAGLSINGDAFVKFGVFGTRPSGWFDVDDGILDTPYIIYDDHSMEKVAVSEYVYLEASDDSSKEHVEVAERVEFDKGWYRWEYYEKSHRLFNEKVWDEKENFNINTFFDLVKNGENPFQNLK